MWKNNLPANELSIQPGQRNWSLLSVKMRGWITCVYLLFALTVHSAWAVDYFVNDDSTVGDVYTTAPGSTTNSGSASQPWPSLRFALQATNLVAGDTVFVDTGEYQTNATISIGANGSSGNPITIQGSTGLTSRTTLRATASIDAFSISGDYVHLRDLTIRDSRYGINLGADNCEFVRIRAISNIRGFSMGFFPNWFSHCVTVSNIVGVYINPGNTDYFWNHGVSWQDSVAFDVDAGTVAISNSVIVGGTAFGRGASSLGDYNVLWDTKIHESVVNLAELQVGGAWLHSAVMDPAFNNPSALDFHPRSEIGRLDPSTTNFVSDASHSVLIDFVRPALGVTNETNPNGGIANAGIYGNTAEASQSLTNEWLLALTYSDGGTLMGTSSLYWAYSTNLGSTATATIAYSPNNGVTWSNIITGHRITNGFYTWDASAEPSSLQARWRIIADGSSGAADTNDARFVIRNGFFSLYVNDASLSGDVYTTNIGMTAHDGLTPGTPKSELGNILDEYELGPGDTIYVDTGIYNLTSSVVITFADEGDAANPMVIQGSTNVAAGGTVLDQGSATFDVVRYSGAAHCRLAHITVQNGRDGVNINADDPANSCEMFYVRSVSNAMNGFQLGGSFHRLTRCAAIENDIGVSVKSGNTGEQWDHGILVSNTTVAFSSPATALTVSNSIIMGGPAFAGPGIDVGDYNIFWQSSFGAFNFLFEFQAAKGDWYNSVVIDPQLADMTGRDFHPLSQAGRFDPISKLFTNDLVTSIAVDFGDPSSPSGAEPSPNGNRLNVGVHGNTEEASKSPTNERLYALTYNDGGQLTPPTDPVYWSYQGTNLGATVRIEFSGDQGSNWNVAVTGLLATGGVYVWTNTNFPSSRFSKWRVVLEHDPNVFDAIDTDIVFRNGPFVYYVNDTNQVGDIYTSAPGDDGNLGVTSNSPKATLTALLAAYDLDAGDIVFVDTGVYQPIAAVTFGALDSGATNDPVVFQGSTNYAAGGSVFERETTIGTLFFVNGANDIQLNNFTLNAVDVGLLVVDSTRVEHSWVFSAEHRDFAANIINSSFISFDNCAFSESEVGVRLSSATQISWDHCVSWGNELRALQLDSGSFIVSNSVLAADGPNAYIYDIDDPASVSGDYNDLYTANDALVAYVDSLGRNIDTLSAWIGFTDQDRHSLSVDPAFADPLAGDFHLRTRTFQGRYDLSGSLKTDVDTSLLIDSGSPSGDFAEEPSPNASRVNIGLYGGSHQASMGRTSAWIYAASPVNGGWVRGTGSLHWVANNLTNGSSVDVDYSYDGGLTWSTLTNDIPATNELFVWDTTATNDTPAGLWRVVSASDSNVADTITTYFAVRNADLSIYVNDFNPTNDVFTVGPGSPTNYVATTNRPLNSLLSAIQLFDLEPGDAIYVDAGLYEHPGGNLSFGRLDMGASSAWIRVQGSPAVGSPSLFRRKTTSQGSYGLELENTGWLTFSNLTFEGASVGVYAQDVEDVILSTRSVRNASNGIEIIESENIVLHRAVSDQNEHDGLVVEDVQNIEVTHSIIWSNGQDAVDKDESDISLTHSVLSASGIGSYILRMAGGPPETFQSDFNVMLASDGGRIALMTGAVHRFLYSWQSSSSNDVGTLTHDPRFANAATGDFHVLSAAGRVSLEGNVVTDLVSSLLIDAGDPAASVGSEPPPNGAKLNIGQYGGALGASRSPTNAVLVALTLSDGGSIRDTGNLHWLAYGPAAAATVYIDYSADGGTTWSNIATNVAAATGFVVWDTTNFLSSTLGKWRIVDQSNSNVFDETDNLFAVKNESLAYYVNDASTNGDVYAEAIGSPDNSGLRPESPMDSINDLVQRYEVREGDLIFIDTGEYSDGTVRLDEFTAQGSLTNRVVIQGSTNLAAGGTRLNMQGNDGIRIDDTGSINIRHLVITNAKAGIVFNRATNCLVEHLLVEGATAGFELDKAHDTRFEHTGIGGRTIGGITLFSSQNVTWEHGSIFGSGVIFSVQSGSGLAVSNSSMRTIGTALDGTVYEVLGGGSVVANYNNIDVSEGALVASTFLPGETAPRIYENVTSWALDTGNDVHSLSGDAGFANPAGLDFHVLSASGRYEVASTMFVQDVESSILIDAGDPNRDASIEPEQDGNRINIGMYGGTDEASMTPSLRTYTISSYNDGGVAVGTNVVLRWVARGDGTSDTVRLDFSPDGGQTWQLIDTGIAASDEQYVWDTTSFTSTPRALWRILRVGSPSAVDVSDSIFALRNAPFEFYVNDTNAVGDVYSAVVGSPTNNGLTLNEPMDSLQLLLDTYDLEGGDTVFVDTGEYADEERIFVAQPDGGETGSPVIFQGSTDVTNGGSHFELTSLQFDGTRGVLARQLNIAAPTNSELGAGIVLFRATNSWFEWISVESGDGGANLLNSENAHFRHCLIASVSNGFSMAGSTHVSWDHGVLWSNGVALSIQGGEFSFSNSIVGVLGQGQAAYVGVLNSVEANYNNIYRSDPRSRVAIDASDPTSVPRVYDSVSRWSTETGHDTHSLSHDPAFFDAPESNYYLVSQAGRFSDGVFTNDVATSVLIDAGDPARAATDELSPNGGRINLGLYGSTAQASKTPTNSALTLISYNDGGIAVGTNAMLRWLPRGDATGHVVNLDYSADAGGSWVPIAAGLAATTEVYVWDTTSYTSTPRALWRITSADDTSVTDKSDYIFAVRNNNFEFYVNDGGTNGDVFTAAIGASTNTGVSQASPLPSVENVLETYDLEAGDTVYVDTGVYSNDEALVIGQLDSADSTNGQHVVFVGSPNTAAGGAQIIRGGIAVGIDLVRVKGVTLSNFYITASSAGLRLTDSTDVNLDWVHISDSFRGFDLGAGEDIRLRHCVARNCSKDGISLLATRDVMWQHGVLWSNAENAVSVLGGFLALDSSVIGAFGSEARAYRDSGTLLSDYNAIFLADGASAGIRQGDADSEFDDVFETVSAWARATTNDSRTLTRDPLFVDASVGDFHLRSVAGNRTITSAVYTADTVTSPLIDAGNPTDDIGEEPPSNGSRVNIGLYGSTAQASLTPTNAAIIIASLDDGGRAEGLSWPLYWVARGDALSHTLQLEFSPDDGSTWELVSPGVPASDQSFIWNTAIHTSTIRAVWRLVSIKDTNVYDESRALFAVRNDRLRFYVNNNATNGDIYTVSPGSPANDGATPATPSDSIQAVLDRWDTEPGDTILVDSGEYILADPVTIGPFDRGLSLEGNTNHLTIMGATNLLESTIIRKAFGGTAFVLHEAPGTALRHMSIRDAFTAVESLNSSYNTFEWLVCRDGSIGIRTFDSPNTRIAHCVLRNNSGSGVSAGGSFSVTHIENCVVWSNKIGVRQNRGQLDLRNSVFGQFGKGTFAYFLIGSVITADYNNVILKDGAEAVGTQVSETANTNFFSTVAQWASSSGQDIHTLTIPPGFADLDNGDYHLKSSGGRFLPGGGETNDSESESSRMIDTGDPASEFDMEPDINGGRVNMGLYGNSIEASRTPTNGWYIPITFSDGGSGKDLIELTWFAGWIATGHTVRLDYSPDSGASWVGIVTNIDAVPSTYLWNSEPYGRSARSRWRITSLVNSTIAATTTVDFILRNGGTIPYYVNDSSTNGDVYTTSPCDPSNSGLTSNEPVCSIMTILTNNVLEPEDVIFVDTGVYPLSDPVVVDARDTGNSTGRVHIIGSTNFGAGGTVLDRVTGVGDVMLLLQVEGIELKNLTLRNAAYGLRLDSSFFIEMDTIRSEFNTLSGLVLENMASASIVNSIIYANGTSGVRNASSTLSMDRSVVWNNGAALNLMGSSETEVRNSVLQASGEGSRLIQLELDSVVTNFDYNNLVREDLAIIAEKVVPLLGTEVLESSTDWKKEFALDTHSLAHEPLFASDIGGDFHPQSITGRFDSAGNVSVDAEHSPLIDTGEPTASFTNELMPNGGRLNIGAYGNTHEASLSRTNPWLLAVSLNDGGTISGTNQLIWVAGNMKTTDTVRLQISVDGGIEYSTLVSNLPALQVTGYPWVVSESLTTLAKWQVLSENYTNASDASDSTFSIRTNIFDIYVNDGSTNGDMYTSAPGHPTNDGLSASQPLHDPLVAIQRYPVEAGDTIFIDTGYYVMTNTLVLDELNRGESNSPIRVFGSTNLLAGGTVLSLATNITSVMRLSSTRYVEINDLQLTRGTVGLQLDTSIGVSLSGIRAYSNAAHGFSISQVLPLSMDRCVSAHNNGWGLTLGAVDATWEQGVIWSNRLGGVQLSGGTLAMRHNIIHSYADGPLFVAAGGSYDNDYNILHRTDGGFAATNLLVAAGFDNLKAWQDATGGDIHSVFVDPLIADSASGQFNLLSEAGRYDAGVIVTDVVTSWAIDAGDSLEPFFNETPPNGDRLNVGLHGHTFRASRSWTNEPELLVSSLSDGGEMNDDQLLYWLSRGLSTTSRVTLEVSIDNGVTWRVIQSDLPANNTGYLWGNTNPPSPLARWRVFDQADTNVVDATDTNFFLRIGNVTYYVNDADTNGDVYASAPGAPGNDGLFTNSPNTSIQFILNTYELQGGDKILVDTGTYGITNPITVGIFDSGVATNRVDIIGSPNKAAGGTVIDVLDPSINGFLMNLVSGVRIANMEIVGADIGINLSKTASFIAEDCIIRDGGQAGVSILDASSNNRFERLLITRNTGVGVLNIGANNTFESCIIWSNGLDAIEMQKASLSISNSVLSADGDDVYCLRLATNTLVFSDYNAFVVTNGANIALFQGIPAEAIAQWTAASTQDLHSINIDPLFADPDNDDYHLLSTSGRFVPGVGFTNDLVHSQLIDAGSPLSVFTNEADPNGGVINIGLHGNTADASLSETNKNLIALTASSGGRLSGVLFLVWRADNIQTSETVRLDYSFDDGSTWVEIATNRSVDPNQYLWNSIEMSGGSNVFPSSPLGRWRVSLESDTNVFDITDESFFLNGPFTFYVNDSSTVDDIFTSAIGDNTNLGFFAHVPMASLRELLIRYDLEGPDQVFIDTGVYLVQTNASVGQTIGDAGKAGQHVLIRGSTNGVGSVFDRASVGVPIVIYDVNAAFVDIADIILDGGDLRTAAIELNISRVSITNGNLAISGADQLLEDVSVVGGNLSVVGTNISVIGLTMQNGQATLRGRDLLLQESSFSTTSDVALVIDNGDEVQVLNNTIIGERSAFRQTGDGSDSVLRNNILIAGGSAADDAYVIHRQAGFLDSDYNNLVSRGGAWIGNAGGNWERLFYWQRESGQDQHSLSHDPLFADEAGFDFHLRSSAGRYSGGAFVIDGVDSPMIDAGDPSYVFTNEPSPSGSRINIGAYGGTVEASKSRTTPWLLALTMNDSGVLKSTNVFMRWAYGGMSTTNRVALDYSSDGGTNWQAVAGNLAVDASGYFWDTTSFTSSLTALWRVRLDNDTSVVDQVDNLFALRNEPLNFYVNNVLTTDDVYTVAAGASTNDGLSPATPLDSIQRVFTNYDVEALDTIYVDTGVYTNNSDAVVIWSDGGDQDGQLLIQGSTNHAAGGTTFNRNDTSAGRDGFDVKGSYVTLRDFSVLRANRGVFFDSNRFSSIERFMVFSNLQGIVLSKTLNITNLNTRYWNNTLGGISISQARTTVVENATFVGNKPYAYNLLNSVENTLQNNIFYLSTTNTTAIAGTSGDLDDAFIDYNVYYFAASNTSIDGVYRDLTSWQRDKEHDYRSNITNPLFNNTESGDFHLMSTEGRFEVGVGWVNDGVNAWPIDKGNPFLSFTNEPALSGDRINIGAFGNTEFASKGTTNPFLFARSLNDPFTLDANDNPMPLVWTAHRTPSGATVRVEYSGDNGFNWVTLTNVPALREYMVWQLLPLYNTYDNGLWRVFIDGSNPLNLADTNDANIGMFFGEFAINSLFRSGSGLNNFTFRGAWGEFYLVQYTTNLVNTNLPWVNASSGTGAIQKAFFKSTIGGDLPYEDPDHVADTMRVYRVINLPPED